MRKFSKEGFSDSTICPRMPPDGIMHFASEEGQANLRAAVQQRYKLMPKDPWSGVSLLEGNEKYTDGSFDQDKGNCGWALVCGKSTIQLSQEADSNEDWQNTGYQPQKFEPGIALLKRLPMHSGTQQCTINFAEVEAVMTSVECVEWVEESQTFSDSQVAKSISDAPQDMSARLAMREPFGPQRSRMEIHRKFLKSVSSMELANLTGIGIRQLSNVETLKLDAQHRKRQLEQIQKEKKSIISWKSPNPVSYIPSHQDERKLDPDPDEIAQQGNNAADGLAKDASRFPPPPDTWYPVGDKRFVVTSDCRMVCGDVSKYIRNLGQIHGLAKVVEDVKRLKTLVDEAMQDSELDQRREEDEEQDQEGVLIRRSDRNANKPRPNYNEVSVDLQCDEEGGFIDDEVSGHHLPLSCGSRGGNHQSSRPTTHGVVMKALLANPGYRFNPNLTMASSLIAGHRWLSHTRRVRGDGKLRRMLLESKALQNDNVLSSLEPEAVDVIDLCPLCLKSEQGCVMRKEDSSMMR